MFQDPLPRLGGKLVRLMLGVALHQLVQQFQLMPIPTTRSTSDQMKPQSPPLQSIQRMFARIGHQSAGQPAILIDQMKCSTHYLAWGF